MTARTYCCAGKRWLGRHTADCEGLFVFGEPTTTVGGEIADVHRVAIDQPATTLACGCVGGNACGQGLCE